MLCKQNCGKYLDSTWEKDRQRAMAHSDDSDLEWLELDSSDIGGIYNKETFEVRSSPIEPTTSDKKIDMRNRDEYK